MNVINAFDGSTKVIEKAVFVEVSNLEIGYDDNSLVAILPVDDNFVKWTQVTFTLESVIDTATDLPVADAVIQLQYVDALNFGSSEFATLTNLTPGDVFMTSGLYPEFGNSDQNTNTSSIMGIALYNPSLSADYYVTGTLSLAL